MTLKGLLLTFIIQPEKFGGKATSGSLWDPPQLNAWMNRFEISSVALTFAGWLIDCVDGVTELSKVLILNVPLSILIKRDRHSAGWNFKNRFSVIQASICFNIYLCSQTEVR